MCLALEMNYSMEPIISYCGCCLVEAVSKRSEQSINDGINEPSILQIERDSILLTNKSGAKNHFLKRRYKRSVVLFKLKAAIVPHTKPKTKKAGDISLNGPT